MKGHPEELLSAYADGELDAAGRADVEAHLVSCAVCRALLEDLRVVARVEPDDTALDEVTVRRFLAENRELRAKGEAAPSAAKRAGPPAAAAFSFLAAAAVFLVVAAAFVALGGPMKNMFSNAASSQTLGQGQAAISQTVY